MGDDSILIMELNNTIVLDDCPPRTRETMQLATNFTFWTEGIIQVCKNSSVTCIILLVNVKFLLLKHTGTYIILPVA